MSIAQLKKRYSEMRGNENRPTFERRTVRKIHFRSYVQTADIKEKVISKEFLLSSLE